MKLSLPYANDYKASIESLIYRQLNVELSIGSISASWQGSGPALVLENVSFEDNQNAPISLYIDNTSLQVNVVQSLRQWQLVSNYFVLDGFKANIHLDRLNLAESSGEFEQQALLEGLFLGETGHFAVQNSEIKLFLEQEKHHKVLVRDMVWQNSANAHHGEGRLIFPSLSQGSLNTRVKLSGETLHEITGDIYLQARDLNVLDLIDEHLDDDYRNLSASINGQLWGQLEQGKLRDILIEVQPSYVTWLDSSQSNKLGLEAGQVRLVPIGKDWSLSSSEFLFSSNGHEYPPMHFQGLWSNSDTTFWIQQFNLEPIAHALALTHYNWAKGIEQSQFQGVLSKAKLSFSDSDGTTAWGAFKNIGWQESDKVPGLKGLDLEFNWQKERGVVSVSAHQQQLVTGSRFIAPIDIDELNGDIHFWQDKQDNWHVNSDNLWVSNKQIAVALEFHTRLFEFPELDLYAEAFAKDAAIAGHYFPLDLMHGNLVEYLDRGIIAGEDVRAQVLLSGPLSAFPFRDKQGQFEVLAKIHGAEFLFAPDWQSVKEAAVELHFHNERMDILATSGKLSNQTITGEVLVSLPDLEQADNLYVKIKQQTEAASLKDFFADSPIADPLVNVLEVVQGQGLAQGDIALDIDLKDLNVIAKGNVLLNNNRVYLSKPGMQLDNVTGELVFQDDEIKLMNAKATWLQMPIDFSVMGSGDKQGYEVNVQTSLLANSEALLPHGTGLMDGFIAGTTVLDTNLALNFTEQGFNYLASFSSDLSGTAVTLPAPYNKLAQAKGKLIGEVRGDDISNLITANVNDLLYFNGILDNQSGRFEKAHLVISKQNRGLDRPGFSVTIDQDELQLDNWFEFLDRVIEQTTGSTEQTQSLLPQFSEIRANLGQLHIGNILFNDIEMQMKPDSDGFEMRLNGKELRAQVLLPSQDTNPIRVQADYLRVNTQQTEATEKPKAHTGGDEWLVNLPAIEFGCDDCRINQYQLDRVNLAFSGNGEQLIISNLNVDKGTHTLSAKGSWQDGVSQINGNLSSADFGDLMEEFDITSTVKDSQANIDFDLNWRAAPYDFDWETLGGEIQWQLGEGHLTDISDQGARVFSLLSLDSLVRKLKLDFRDVFAKGFFYNQMEGSLQIDNGVAYTQDTKMDGVPADLSITGYVNLKTHEINYDLAIAPQVTSSLPVIVGWMVNPVTGLAALAIDKVIHSARVISEINFKVTGTMQEPVVTEVDRKSREVTIPGVAAPEEPNLAPSSQKQDANQGEQDKPEQVDSSSPSSLKLKEGKQDGEGQKSTENLGIKPSIEAPEQPVKKDTQVSDELNKHTDIVL
ncbi:YhdP family protein [Pseudoalteromonas luteoviolacea]|uniref:YhdP family protein n=1 Tax=Pseudoalteromonas luteoviolacea TaxID=43657 RepID=UPI001E58C310